MAAGKVWLVGAGPGDIGLFTLKGAAVLQQADVVVYDSLVGEGVLAKIPEHARLINVGKRANHHTMLVCSDKVLGLIRFFWKKLKKEIKW